MSEVKIYLPREHFDEYYEIVSPHFCSNVAEDGEVCYYRVIFIDEEKVILIPFEESSRDDPKEIH
jgi:hypothetical protein